MRDETPSLDHSRYARLTDLSATRHLNWPSALGVWAAICFAAALSVPRQGIGGRELPVTLSVFALYLGIALLLAARGITERLLVSYGSAAGFFLGLALLIAYLIYALGTNSISLGHASIASAFVFLPLGLVASAAPTAPGAWQDYVSLGASWVAVKFYLSEWLWPYPDGRLSHILTILLAMDVALACFLLVRKVDGTGYSIGWGNRWTFLILSSFGLFAVIAIPLGTTIHFIQFEPRYQDFKSLPLTALYILVFTAWPEELLFRGLLQNLLSRTLTSDALGWICASVLFGFSHITNYHFPNWRYVLLGSIAGLFYGWTWRKSGSIFASALVHTLVNTTWHFLFLTL
jgi:membrane protease YdiL (CAAX protease family)